MFVKNKYSRISIAAAFTAALSMALAMVSCSNGDNSGNAKLPGAAPYRILSIGASFTSDAMTYLHDMLVKNGVPAKDIDIVNAYVGGQTLKNHALHAEYELYTYERRTHGAKGSITSIPNVKLKDIVSSNYWDYISIQQGADQAGNLAAYADEDIEYLLEFAKENCKNPNVKIMFHLTWAYDEGTTQQSVWNSFNGNQMEMYTAITDAVQAKILPYEEFEIIIPSGTAIQNARTIFTKVLTGGDGYHLNDFGKFIAGAMWLRQIYGSDKGFNLDVFNAPYQARNNTTISVSDMAIIAKCAEDAFEHPFEVTDQ